jgi:hypothetical protein
MSLVVARLHRSDSGRRKRPLAAALAVALGLLGSTPIVARAIDGVGPLDLPNPNTNSVQVYCTANYPGTEAVVISTGSVSNGGTNQRVDQGYFLKWKETYVPSGVGTTNNVEAEIFELRVGSSTGERLEYVAAFSFVGGNDTYLFAIGTPVQSSTVGATPPADSLKMANFNGSNFTQWGFCAYATKVPVSITKTVSGGLSGNFVFTVSCTILSAGKTIAVSGYPLDVNVSVTNGGPVTVVAPITVPVGSSCTATEKAGAGDEPKYTHEGPQTKVTAVDGANFAFTNVLRTGKLSFTKTVSGAVAGEDYSFRFALNCDDDTYDVNPIVLSSAGSLTFTSVDIPAGVACNITELSSTPAGAWNVEGSPTAPVTVVRGATTAIPGITNTRKVGYFSVAKTTSDGGAATFTFDVTCGGVLVSENLAVIAGGVSSVVGPIPTGTSCTITENPDEPDLYQEGAPQTFTITESTVATAAVKSFVNVRRTGKLSFTKTVVGAVEGEAYSFDFALDCAGSAFDATFTLPDAGSLVYTTGDIPSGTSCTVTETSAKPSGAWTVTGSPTGATEVVANATTPLSGITNTRKVANLTITKTVSDGGEGTFTVDYSCKLGTIVVREGSNVQVSPTTPIVVSNLPTSTICTVTEDAAAGYTTTYSTVGGVVTVSDTGATLAITNTAIDPKLTLVKRVVKPTGSSNPATASSWTLTANPAAPKAGQSVALSETPNAGLAGTWAASSWDCVGTGITSQNGSAVVMERAAEVTCTVTNTLVDIMIVKDVAKRVGVDCDGGDEVWVDNLSMVVTGTALCYRFTVTNTGSAPLDNISLTDAMLGLTATTCGSTSLAPGASTSCTTAHTATFTSGVVRTNVATANGCATIGAKPCVKDDDTATYVASYQGFTPGFWKNHTAVNSNNAWTATYIGACIPPLVETAAGLRDYWNTPVTTIFPGTGTAVAFKGKQVVSIANYNGTGKPMTLLQALGLSGGGGDAGANGILLRAATSSWLNACYNETDPTLAIGLTWPESSAKISTDTVSALTTQTRTQRISLAGKYDLWNNTATHFIDWNK